MWPLVQWQTANLWSNPELWINQNGEELSGMIAAFVVLHATVVIIAGYFFWSMYTDYNSWVRYCDLLSGTYDCV